MSKNKTFLKTLILMLYCFFTSFLNAQMCFEKGARQYNADGCATLVRECCPYPGSQKGEWSEWVEFNPGKKKYNICKDISCPSGYHLYNGKCISCKNFYKWSEKKECCIPDYTDMDNCSKTDFDFPVYTMKSCMTAKSEGNYFGAHGGACSIFRQMYRGGVEAAENPLPPLSEPEECVVVESASSSNPGENKFVYNGCNIGGSQYYSCSSLPKNIDPYFTSNNNNLCGYCPQESAFAEMTFYFLAPNEVYASYKNCTKATIQATKVTCKYKAEASGQSGGGTYGSYSEGENMYTGGYAYLCSCYPEDESVLSCANTYNVL